MLHMDLLSTGQVASKAKVHRTTVHHWERTGKLHAAAVVNGIRLFSSDEVERFLSERAGVES